MMLVKLFILFGITFAEDNFTEREAYIEEILPNATGLQDAAIIAMKSFRKPKFHGMKPLLCVVFMKTSHESMHLLRNNMIHAKESCDWAAIAYKGEIKQLHVLQKEAYEFGSRLVYYSVETDSDVHNTTISPHTFSVQAKMKPVLQARLLPLLPNYQRVWLLDEDMSLSGFDIRYFLKVVNCYGYPKHPPLLVAQTIVAESTQYWPYFNKKYWDNYNKTHEKPVLAISLGYIEQQHPLFDANFFAWYVRYMMIPMGDVIRSTSSDWGVDKMWCKSAALFAKTVYGHNTSYNESCLLVVGGTPIHHLDSKAASSKRSYIQGGFYQSKVVHRLFNDFAVEYTTVLEEKYFSRAISELHPECPY